MANPQAEHGHVDIANEIVESLARIRLSGEEVQCLWVIFRKTYGWKKTEDIISLSQFSEMTGLKRQHIHRALLKLSSKKVIDVTKNGYNRPNMIRFVKDFDIWVLSPKKVTPGKNVTKDGAYKRQKNKDSNVRTHKIRTKEVSEDSVSFKLASYLWKLIYQNFPKTKPPDLQRWARPVDLMIRVDKREPDDIGRVIEWSQKSEFWKSNILSTEKLRKQFDTLLAKMGGRS